MSISESSTEDKEALLMLVPFAVILIKSYNVETNFHPAYEIHAFFYKQSKTGWGMLIEKACSRSKYTFIMLIH